jgi:hypothetical protein
MRAEVNQETAAMKRFNQNGRTQKFVPRPGAVHFSWFDRRGQVDGRKSADPTT